MRDVTITYADVNLGYQALLGIIEGEVERGRDGAVIREVRKPQRMDSRISLKLAPTIRALRLAHEDFLAERKNILERITGDMPEEVTPKIQADADADFDRTVNDLLRQTVTLRFEPLAYDEFGKVYIDAVQWDRLARAKIVTGIEGVDDAVPEEDPRGLITPDEQTDEE